MRRRNLISLMIIACMLMLFGTVTASAKTVSEHEPNGNFHSANVINIGDKVNAKWGPFNDDEEDYFVFAAPESGKLRFTAELFGSSDSYLQFHIYDNNFEEIWRDGVGPKESDIIKVACGKKYYVSVTSGLFQEPLKYAISTKYEIDKTKITKVKAKKTSAKVTWKKKNEASYYQIRYASPSSYSRFGWTKGKTIKASRNASSKTITKLKKKHSYYVTVRVVRIVQGKTYYSGWSGKKLIKTKKK